MIDLAWESESSQDLLELIYKTTVRGPMLIEHQTSKAAQKFARRLCKAQNSGDAVARFA